MSDITFDQVFEDAMKLPPGDQRRLIDLLKVSTSETMPHKTIEQIAAEQGKGPLNFDELRRLGEFFPADESIDELVQTVRDLRHDQMDRDVE
ncbi:MAG: hypothetical protein MOB07_21735 [Acidobacteria bacterium]|nr:hypothetical protein [Acidobacteriota bacterium]